MNSSIFLTGGTYGIPAMRPPILNVSHLTKRFGAFTAVEDVSFHVNPGEIVGLLGPNGAGKTTTFHMLLGLITPTSGSVHMFGLDLTVEREAVLQQVNFSSTYLSMPQSLTVEENLWVVGRLYGLPNMRRRVDEIVTRLDMGEFRHKVTRKLSSGQMTRLTLAKALLTKPKILFLDEPTASLDPDVAHKTRALLKEERRASGLSILYTSHNMQEMEDMCDRIIFLQRGKIVTEGTSDEILRRFGERNLEDVFLALARDSTELPAEAALAP